MFKNIKKVYLVGIKGVGMTALAQILQSKNIQVLGSDTNEKFFTDDILNRLNIQFKEGFNAANIPEDVDLVIRSKAYNESNNPEVAEAKNKKLNVISYPEALADLFNDSYGIAVAGSHGKSTTTAMLACILEKAGYDPTVVVGSRVNSWQSNSRVGGSKYFVVEADEYKDAFLRYNPKVIILTNIDYDHPDYFKTRAQYNNSFKEFVSKVSKDNLIIGDGKLLSSWRFNLKLPGEYNQKNAKLAYVAALRIGINGSIAQEALEEFDGLARRFEYVGNYNGVELYDDYAHHPTEITALLRAIKDNYPSKRSIILFQPHTFTRTQELFANFANSFDLADKVYILKTYGSARESGEDFWGKKLAKSLKVTYLETHEDAICKLEIELNEGMVFFAVGAGDGWQIASSLSKKS